MLQEYGANKGVGENPLNGNGVARYKKYRAKKWSILT
nr:MAG TPA: hypothetical protein [Caudoviricetes sp.]